MSSGSGISSIIAIVVASSNINVNICLIFSYY